MKQEIYSLNYFKGICGIMVVMIHAGLYKKFLLSPLYRCAVPLFFMISGYFLMGSNGEWHREKIGKYIKKMLLIWGITNLVYIIFSEFIFTDHSIIHSHSNILLLIVREITIGGQFCYPLWYITAYVWALIVLRFWKCKSDKINLCLIGFLLLINISLGAYNCIFKLVHNFITNNFLTSALPFVILGGILKRYTATHTGPKIKSIVYLLIISYVERLFLWHRGYTKGDLFFITPILSFLILMWFVNHPKFGQTSWIRTIGKNYSLNIYLFHLLVMWIVEAGCTQIGLDIMNYEFLIVFPSPSIFVI